MYFQNRKTMKQLATLITGLIIYQISFAQVPVLNVQDSKREQNLEISKLHVSVDVTGNIAATTFDIVFYNPVGRILEGELSMPLGDGQEICRYALEVNGKLREGVVIEKVKARQTFEAVVRQNIDPGIAGMTKGNFFKTRIFPIPANGTKRVVLALTETLKGDSKNLYYSLPVETTKKISEFRVDVRVFKGQSEKTGALPEFGNVEFDTREDAYCLNFERTDFHPVAPLNFTIPRFVKTDHQLFTCELNGETYFYLNAKVPELKASPKRDPQKITVYWDHSFSASGRNITKELTFLHDYLASLGGYREVTLIPFNYQVQASKTFRVKDDASEIISYIQHLKNDGATCFSAIRFDKDCDEILLFSDAVSTIGGSPAGKPNVPVYAVSSAGGSNYAFLKQLAACSNGELIDLNRLSPGKALELIRMNEEKFLSCDYAHTELKEVFPDKPERVNGYLELAGILKGEKASLTVNYGSGGHVTKSRTYEITKGSNAPVSRIWAVKKIEALEMDYENCDKETAKSKLVSGFAGRKQFVRSEKSKKEILQLGCRFNVITPNTSFIVLDRVEDYVTHQITPPDELKEAYHKLMASRVKEQEKSTEVIRNENMERMSWLKLWYEDPARLYKRGAARVEEEPALRIVEDGDVIPVTRQETTPPPPPPGNVSDILNIVDNEEELEIADTEADDASGLRVVPRDSEQYDIPPRKESGSKASIKVLAWLPDAPYLKTLRETDPADIDSLYFVLKEANRDRPAFYIQVADYLFEKRMHDLAVRVLSNTLEMDLENPELLKAVARRLMDEGEPEMAIEIYEEIRDLRPEEPQSYRDLALAYMENRQYAEALDMYVCILDKNWGRFEAIKDVVLSELNNLVSLYPEELDLNAVDPKYLKAMPLDVRITIDWSTNENDIDLWVIDPNGEKCFYSHPHTKLGGKISHDFTRGYGPEEFALKTAKRGTYTVYVNYFSESRQTITGPVTIYATLFTHYGTKQQQAKPITVQLTDHKETRQIGQLEFEL